MFLTVMFIQYNTLTIQELKYHYLFLIYYFLNNSNQLPSDTGKHKPVELLLKYAMYKKLRGNYILDWSLKNVWVQNCKTHLRCKKIYKN